MMRTNRLPLIVLTLLILLGGLVSLGSSPAEAQGGNLLTNPSFEAPYAAYIPETAQEQADCPMGICNTAQVPAGWKPWWVKERPTDVNPEYKPADTGAAGNRVRSGQFAAQYFSFWTTHKAGLRQTVTVPAGATVEFSVWGHSWLSEEDDPFSSDYSGTSNMRVGIDPTGGTNPYGPAIVWSEYKQAFDSYQLFTVSAQAQGTQVTVFTFAAPSVNPNSPDYGFKHADIYWDDAALVVSGGAVAPPAPTTAPADPAGQPAQPAAPAAPLAVGPTATPNADGLIMVEVQPGDSLWAIAARAGLTMEELLQLNEMAEGAVIRPGDLIIIGRAEAPTPTPEPTEPAAATEEAVAAAPTATPEPVEASICLLAFNDDNQDGVRDADETLRDAVAFTITDGESVVTNYVTDGVSEPFCVQIAEPGEYQVTRSTVPNELLTTSGDMAVTLAAGDVEELEFGSYVDDEAALARIAAVNPDAPAEATIAADEGAQVEPEDGGTLSGVAIAAVVVALIILVGVLLVILSARRAAG